MTDAPGLLANRPAIGSRANRQRCRPKSQPHLQGPAYDFLNIDVFRPYPLATFRALQCHHQAPPETYANISHQLDTVAVRFYNLLNLRV